MLLRSARLADGRLVDVRLSGVTIGSVTPSDQAGPAEGPSETIDLAGYLLLPAPAEPHAHLDKALTADLIANPRGDLPSAIEVWMAHYDDRTIDEIAGRARRAALHTLAHGCTAIRTHVDLNSLIGLRAVRALLHVRAELAPLIDIQLVALVGRPFAGPDGAAHRALLAEAYDLGMDIGGGAAHLDVDSRGHIDLAIEAAARRGRPLDLHTDENLELDSLDLRYLARRVMATGFEHGVVASHCTSLGMQPASFQADVAAEVAAAGISVVTLPQTNLFLQARGTRTATPRGLTAIAALLEGGVNVAAGADNLQDPFNPVGRGDPLETAALLVLAGHLTTDQAYHAVSTAARAAMGLPAITVSPGDPADLLAIRASSLRDAIANAPMDRLVFSRGHLAAQTTTTTTIRTAQT